MKNFLQIKKEHNPVVVWWKKWKVKFTLKCTSVSQVKHYRRASVFVWIKKKSLESIEYKKNKIYNFRHNKCSESLRQGGKEPSSIAIWEFENLLLLIINQNKENEMIIKFPTTWT